MPWKVQMPRIQKKEPQVWEKTLKKSGLKLCQLRAKDTQRRFGRSEDTNKATMQSNINMSETHENELKEIAHWPFHKTSDAEGSQESWASGKLEAWS